MSPVVDRSYRAVQEPFRLYTPDWSVTTARTDTPDLIGAFRALLTEVYAYRSLDAENLAVHADLAEASYTTLPND